jgi:succinate dehydrogenase hydrophobic anchor subunit
MISEHWFWLVLTAAVLVWYSTVTVYVAIKGTLDIRQMLRRLKNRDETERRR